MLETPIKPSVLTSEQSEGLVNQQGRLTAWLAGLVDGEGTFTFNVNWGRKTYTPRFQVCNTDFGALDRCKEIFDRNGIAYHIKTQKLKETWKVVWVLETTRLTEVKKIAELLIPDLIIKKRIAELVVDFIKLKMNGAYHGYSEEQIAIIKAVKKFNHRGPSETLRFPFPKGIEDKVQA